MRRFPVVFAALLTLVASASVVRATGFSAELKVTDGKAAQSARGKRVDDAGAMPRRVTLEAPADGSFTANWKVTRTDSIEAKDVLVHFYVVKLDRPGQAPPALEPGKVAIESALTMDFAKGKAANAAQQFRLDGPGVYLVRIEAGGDPDKPGQEDFAEIELTVN